MKHIYKVLISPEALEYRLSILMEIESVEIACTGKDGEFILTCYDEDAEVVEYELRKAERRDDYCEWEKIS